MNYRPYIAIPTYSGQLAVECVGSLLANIRHLTSLGVVPDIEFKQGLCYIGLARNVLLTGFMESDATHMLFWDDDVAPPWDGVARIMSHDVEIVAAVYPAKTPGAEAYPWRMMEEGERRGTLIEAEGLPTGFMCIRRDAVERMIKAYPDRLMIDPVFKRRDYNFFSCELIGQTWWGEDYRFCQLARAIGIKTWCDPNMTLRHVGRSVWKGNLGAYLDGQSNPYSFNGDGNGRSTRQSTRSDQGNDRGAAA